jgi:hypothetical protein
MRVLKYEGYSLDEDGLLIFHRKIYVPLNNEIHNLILKEDHREVYISHLRIKNMNAGLKLLLFHKGKKKDIFNFVVRCLEC